MTLERKLAIGALVYLIGAVISFGHGAAQAERDFARRCPTIEVRMKTPLDCVDDAGLSGMGAALFWPLYWSWQVQS